MLLHPGKCCGWTPVLWVYMVFNLWDGKPISLSTQRFVHNFKGHFLFTTWKTGKHSCLSEGKTGGNWALDCGGMFLLGEQWKFPGCFGKVDAVVEDNRKINTSFAKFLQRSCHFQHIGFCTVLAVLEDRLCLFSENKSLSKVACRSMATDQ